MTNFSSTTTFENELNTKEYGTTYREEFVSPDNWLPGDTTDKTVTVTNSGQVDEAVRINLSETWTPNNTNTTLNGWIHADGTKSNHTTENELSTDVRAAIINFTNNSDWTKVGDYYYYNYRLAPGQTTDSLIESVTFNALTKLGDTCVTSSENDIKTITCNSSGEDYDHATYTLTVNIETVQYNKYQEAWNTDVAIAESKPQGVNFAQHIMNKSNAATVTNYTDGVTTEAYTFEHGATAQTPALTDYRYIGASPNNYVEFNCDDNGENCEIWRAIGVFYVDDGNNNWEWRVKLVRGTSLSTRVPWDNRTSEMYSNENEGKNEWVGSVMQTYLNDNGDYYLRTGSAANYGLKATAKTLISDAKYYLGGRAWISGNQPYGSTEEMYNWERGLETFSYESFCLYNIYHSTWRNRCSSENYCENNPTDGICDATRTLNWKGEIALMYPSDMYMTYANGVDTICYDDPYECTNMHPPYYGVENPGIPTTSWLYLTNENDCFLSPEIQSSISVFYLYGGGNSNYSVLGCSSGNSNSDQGIRPVLYLSSSVKTTSGDGSIDSPYKLSL